MANAFVQGAHGKWTGGSGTSESVSFTNNVGAGNLIVVVFGWSGGTGANVSSVAMTGESFTAVPSYPMTDGTAGALAIYYAKNATGGQKQITVTWSADPGFGSFEIFEFSGADTTSPLGQSAAANKQVAPGAGTNQLVSSAVTTATNGEIVVGGVFDENGGATLTVGTGFSQFQDDSSNGAAEMQIQTSAGSITVTFSQSGDNFGTYLTGIATFKAAGGGGASDTQEWRGSYPPAKRTTWPSVTY